MLHPDIIQTCLACSSTQLYSSGIIYSLWVTRMTCIDICFKYVPTIWRFNRSRAVVAVPSLERLILFLLFRNQILKYLLQISLHLGVSGKPNRVATLIPRSNSLQYRLTESGPDFFERGTSESVL